MLLLLAIHFFILAKIITMKKTLTLFFAVLLVVTLTSCNNVLDKKINKESLLKDIHQIKQENGDKYSIDDFAALTLGIEMGNASVIRNLDGTYRNALDNIQMARAKAKADSVQKAQKYQAELKVYNDKVGALTKAINLKVIGKGSQPVNDFDELFVFAYTIANGAPQPVAGFEGKVVVTDLAGNPVAPINITYKNNIDAGKTIQYKDTYDYNEMDGDQIILMNTPYDSLRFSWQPSKVVFKDGTSITAPAKPDGPTE